MKRLLFFCIAIALFAPLVTLAQGETNDPCAARGVQSTARTPGVCTSNESACASDYRFGEGFCADESQLCCVLQSDIDANNPSTMQGATSTGTPTLDTGRGSVNDGRSYLVNPLGGRTVPQLIGNMVAWFGTAAGALFFLYLLWGGAEWMAARGDQAQAQRARQRIVAASAGIVVVLLAYTIVSAIVGVIPQ